jgi:hypothetical protein
MSETDCKAVVAEFIRTKGITRCPTACVLPTHGLVAVADRAALEGYAAACDHREKHESLLAGGHFGMSRPHSRGRHNPLRFHGSATAERNLWSV